MAFSQHGFASGGSGEPPLVVDGTIVQGATDGGGDLGSTTVGLGDIYISTGKKLILDSGESTWIEAGDEDDLQVYVDNALLLRYRASTGQIDCYKTLRPSGDASKDLGISVLRWRYGYFSNSVYIGEQAAAGTDVADNGQLWVRSSDNALMYTGEGGTDYVVDLTAA